MFVCPRRRALVGSSTHSEKVPKKATQAVPLRSFPQAARIAPKFERFGFAMSRPIGQNPLPICYSRMKHSFSVRMVETTGGISLLASVLLVSGPRGAELLLEPLTDQSVALMPNLGYIVRSNG
jgi:hypothetical protein